MENCFCCLEGDGELDRSGISLLGALSGCDITIVNIITANALLMLWVEIMRILIPKAAEAVLASSAALTSLKYEQDQLPL